MANVENVYFNRPKLMACDSAPLEIIWTNLEQYYVSEWNLRRIERFRSIY
jgi:hypothetical protein